MIKFRNLFCLFSQLFVSGTRNPATGTRKGYQILVPVFCYQFLVPVSCQYVMGINVHRYCMYRLYDIRTLYSLSLCSFLYVIICLTEMVNKDEYVTQKYLSICLYTP